jgi:hypothetical protein
MKSVTAIAALFIIYATTEEGTTEKVPCENESEMNEIFDLAKGGNYKKITVRQTVNGRIVKNFNVKKSRSALAA